MESELRILRCPDSLRTPKCKYQQNFRNSRRGSASAELFLDTSAADGHDSAASDRQMVRPHMVQDGAAKAVSAARRDSGGARDGVSAERGKPQFLLPSVSGTQRSDVVRPFLPDAARHLDQCSHAAVQDDGGRHGGREAEGQGLLDTVAAMQRRQPRGLSLPHILHLDRHSQHRSQRSHPVFGDMEFLLRRGHTHTLRTLHLHQGQGDASGGICRIPRHRPPGAEGDCGRGGVLEDREGLDVVGIDG